MGGSTETPTDINNIPARIEPLDGSEKIEAMKTGMQRPYMITMRYRDDLTGATSLLYDGRTFDIKSIADPEERHRELHLLAEEISA
jgi:SPP1 family predicted phage head-tail adaptor